jgi:hypothetical protein
MKKSKQLFPIKKIAYKKWLNTKQIDETEYKRLKALTKREVRKRHRQSWETFITQLETDLNRVRTNAFKILNHMRKDIKESVKITCCSK